MTLLLDKLLSYSNNALLTRYEHDYPDSSLNAAEALRELLKFMWLASKHRAERNANPKNMSLHFTCAIHEEMKEIDNMWHTFLLFTQDYQFFCEQYLGGFFHHQPNTQTDKTMTNEEYTNELERYLSYINDNLGEETLLKWFCHE